MVGAGLIGMRFALSETQLTSCVGVTGWVSVL